jgi:hypothetical protein
MTSSEMHCKSCVDDNGKFSDSEFACDFVPERPLTRPLRYVPYVHIFTAHVPTTEQPWQEFDLQCVINVPLFSLGSFLSSVICA